MKAYATMDQFVFKVQQASLWHLLQQTKDSCASRSRMTPTSACSTLGLQAQMRNTVMKHLTASEINHEHVHFLVKNTLILIGSSKRN